MLVYFGAPFRRRTYARILYLLISLPLACLYFTIVVAGVAGSILLPGIVYAWLAAASVERARARRLLGIAIPAPARSRGTAGKSGRGPFALLASADTWRGAAYLLLTLPLACTGFTVGVTVLGVLAAYAAAPPFYLLWTWWVHLHPPAAAMMDVVFGPIPFVGTWHVGTGLSPAAAAGLILDAAAAAALLPAALYLMAAFAAVQGHLAAALLSERPAARRLRAAQEAAERERARAERADRSRRELIVNVSHELRTPIAAIRAHLESILMAAGGDAGAAPDPAGLRRDVAIAHRESERLGALVEDLLILARSDADELRLDLGPVSAAGVIAEVCAAMAPLARSERGVTLVPDAAANLPDIQADRQRLAQVLLNLTRNAVTHTPEGGIVLLGLRPADRDFLELAVSDTGGGIAAEDLERVFERFYRADASRARTAGGSGLGLAIVRDLVTAMGGTIRASSVPGQGSTFRLRLRIARPTAPGPG